ncbi:hypothetical protein BDP67DRAFT_512221 [Colletotrichum lupini]|nr:hypothetical protein BDP67DRAFT_512221 [Colletotrichum lupini]
MVNKLTQSKVLCSESEAKDPGYTMEDPDNVWMNYTVNDDSVEVCFVSPRKGAERFQAALDRASDIVKSIIQAR